MGEGGSERGGSIGIDIGKGEGGLGAGLATGGVSRVYKRQINWRMARRYRRSLGKSEVEAGRGACSLVVGGWDTAAGDGDKVVLCIT